MVRKLDVKVGRGTLACVAVALMLVALAGTACSGKGAKPRGSGASEVAHTEVATTQAGCVEALPPEGELSIEVGGRDREAIIHVPPQIETGLPVVIGLHGYNSSSSDFAEYTGLIGKADESGFVAVVPEGFGTPRKWHFVGLPSIAA